jgi:uncharacterized repeat protein (TIGR02543 family)
MRTSVARRGLPLLGILAMALALGAGCDNPSNPKIQYTITFDSHGGSETADITRDEGTEVQKPADPVWAGQKFLGWFSSAEGGTEYEWPHVLKADITMHARWRALFEYTITFDSHRGSTVDSITDYEDTAVPKPENPEREGYTFAGWFSSAEGGTEYEWPHTLTANVTMHALWQDISRYTIIFNSHEGSTVGMITEKEGTAVSKPGDPTREHYTFAGWFSSAEGGTEYEWPHILTANVTMHARWTVIPERTITFDSHDGTPVDPVTNYVGTAVPQPEYPTRANYAFAGWFSSAEGGAEYEWPHILTANVTMHARWTVRHTITFEREGGSAVAAITANAGTPVPEPAAPYRLGYTFQGWYSAANGGEAYTWPHTLDADVIMYAQWGTITTYTITFDRHDGSATTIIRENEGAKIPKPANPTREGCTFQGWYSAANGGTEYEWPHDLIGNVTMHARWEIRTSDQPISLTIDDLIDPAGSAFNDEPFALVKPDGEKTISISGSDNDANAKWFVGLVQTGTGDSVTLSAANLSLGTHVLRVTAEYGGERYSKELTFTVHKADEGGEE